MENNFKSLAEFFTNNTIALKKIDRRGWKEKLGIANPESVADHSYDTAMICLVLSDLLHYNTEKVIKMALIHDLAETKTGDLLPHEITKKEKETLEKYAINTIFSKLPAKTKKEYLDLWEELQIAETKEAKLVHDVDKLEMALQAKDYLDSGFASHDKIKEFVESSKNQLHNSDVLKIFLAIDYSRGGSNPL